MKANKQSLIRWKVYIDRARMYIGYIQFFMIGLMFFEVFKDTAFGNLIFGNILISIPLLFVLFIGLSLLIGRIDTKLGLREEELRNLSSSNPMLREIHSNIEEIKLEIIELKNK